MGEAEPTLSPWRWVSLFQFCLISAGNAAQWVPFNIVVTQTEEFYGMSAAQVNTMTVIYAIVFAVLAPGAMAVFDKCGLRGGLRTASALNMAGVLLRFVAATVSRDFRTVLASQMLLAASLTFVFPVPPLLAARWFGDHERTLATTIGAMSNSVGLALGQLVPPLIVTPSRHGQAQWCTLWAVLGAYAVVEFVLIFFVVPAGPPKAPSSAESVRAPLRMDDESSVNTPLWRPPHEGQCDVAGAGADVPAPAVVEGRVAAHSRSLGHTLRQMFRVPAFVCIVAAAGVFFASQWSIIALLAQLLKPFGFSEALVGWMGFVNIVVGAVLAVPMGKVVDRYRRYQGPLTAVLTTCTVGYAAFALILFFNPPVGIIPACFVVYTVLGVAQAFAIPLFFEFAVELTFRWTRRSRR